MKKRRHHFVWQYYLDPWASEGRIACLQNGDVFRTNTVNVGVERDFYRLRQFTDFEVAFLRKFVEPMAPPPREQIGRAHV